MQVVAVDVGDAGFEAGADQRIGVLADGDQEVRAQVGTVDAVRELVVERVAVGRVEEVLLELVEDHERRRIGRLDDVLDRGFQRVAPERKLRVLADQRPRGAPRARRSGPPSSRPARR